MSAILSADDLNDFISPGVACIKPVETLPLQKPTADGRSDNPYEVTTEDKLAAQAPPPAQITLTDCLACSGCVTSAEAVLVSLQSHSEVLNALDSAPSYDLEALKPLRNPSNSTSTHREQKIFVASVSPQVRASLAATYGTTEREAGWMIEQLLSGPDGLRSGGKYGNGFDWVVDTNPMRGLNLVMGAEEVARSVGQQYNTSTAAGSTVASPSRPVLTSACPGWICYAEKTHPHVLPHLSKLKSPQALTGTLLKTTLSKTLNIPPSNIWHLAIMPCFDKKLEASRQELTDAYWDLSNREQDAQGTAPVRDVDCVITAREILMLAESRGISFPSMPREPLSLSSQAVFPDERLKEFIFPSQRRKTRYSGQGREAGTSGGFLHHILQHQQRLYPGSIISTERGRNADVLDYTLVHEGVVVFRAARYYGFRNIQNLVRKLKPMKTSRLPGGNVAGPRRTLAGKAELDLGYVEVMACPGGCTNGGGQIKVSDLGELQGVQRAKESQKDWLARVDEAYFSGEDEDEVDNTAAQNTAGLCGHDRSRYFDLCYEYIVTLGGADRALRA